MPTRVQKQRPVETLSHGTLRAAIWKNSGPNGSYYCATFSRACKSGAGFVRNIASFKQAHCTDLLKLIARTEARLAHLNRAALEKLAA